MATPEELLLSVLANPKYTPRSEMQLAATLAGFRGRQPSSSQWKQIIRKAREDGIVTLDNHLNIILV